MSEMRERGRVIRFGAAPERTERKGEGGANPESGTTARRTYTLTPEQVEESVKHMVKADEIRWCLDG
jgi:hypothetical protein